MAFQPTVISDQHGMPAVDQIFRIRNTGELKKADQMQSESILIVPDELRATLKFIKNAFDNISKMKEGDINLTASTIIDFVKSNME